MKNFAALALTLLWANIEAAGSFPRALRHFSMPSQGMMGIGEPVQIADIYSIKNTNLRVTFVVNSIKEPERGMFPKAKLVLMLENRRSFEIANGVAALGAKNPLCQWGIFPNYDTVHNIFTQALSSNAPVYRDLTLERRPFLSNFFHMLVNVFRRKTWNTAAKRFIDLRNIAFPLGKPDWSNAVRVKLSESIWTVSFEIPVPKQFGDYDPDFFEFRFGLIGWGIGKRHIFYGNSLQSYRFLDNDQGDAEYHAVQIKKANDDELEAQRSSNLVSSPIVLETPPPPEITCPRDRGPPGEVMRAYEGQQDTVFRFFFRNYSLGRDTDYHLSYTKSPISTPNKGKAGLAHRVLINWPSKTYSIAVHITSLFTNPGETIFAAYVFTRDKSPVHMFMKRITLNRSLAPPTFASGEPKIKFGEGGELAIYFRKSAEEVKKYS